MENAGHTMFLVVMVNQYEIGSVGHLSWFWYCQLLGEILVVLASQYGFG